jgi:penicillin-binding protein 2
MVAATLANGGTCYQPTLIYQIRQADGSVVRRSPKIRGDLTRDNGLTKDQIEIVRKGMLSVVNAPDGTGKNAAVPGVQVAGKTGTAQFWRKGIKDNHTWFLAFAPYVQPRIALAVMVEGGKSGGGVAAPIAAEIIRKILALDQGYDPGLKPLEPAAGNYELIDSVDFERGLTARTTSASDQGHDSRNARNADHGPKKATLVRPPAPSATPPSRTGPNLFQRFFNLFRR